MGRLCKRVCLSLPALAHRCPSSRPSVRRQSWPCRFNSLGIWVVGLDPHPTPGPFCDGPELRHRQTDGRSDFIYKILHMAKLLLLLLLLQQVRQALATSSRFENVGYFSCCASHQDPIKVEINLLLDSRLNFWIQIALQKIL